MKGYGYTITGGDGTVTIERRPWPGQLPVVILVVLIGLLVGVSFVVSQTGLRMAGGLLVAALIIAGFIRGYISAVKEKLTVDASGMVTWVRLKGFAPKTESMPLEGFMPDARGNRLLARGWVILSRRGTTMTFQGYKARVLILASNGPGQRYTRLLAIRTVEKELKRLSDALPGMLPESRYEPMKSV